MISRVATIDCGALCPFSFEERDYDWGPSWQELEIIRSNGLLGAKRQGHKPQVFRRSVSFNILKAHVLNTVLVAGRQDSGAPLTGRTGIAPRKRLQ